MINIHGIEMHEQRLVSYLHSPDVILVPGEGDLSDGQKGPAKRYLYKGQSL
jgi:hypothetical protein